jgi:hypothetical protein
MPERDDYAQHRDRAREAIERMKRAADEERGARAERDAEVRAMLDTPGATLGSVAHDLGVSKSLIAVIQREGRRTFATVADAEEFIKKHSQTEE